MKQFSVYAASWEKFVPWKKAAINLRATGTASAEGGMLLSSPGISPAYMGVGYIIGPKLASLNFSGGLLAWGLFVPILTYFIGPTLPAEITGGEGGWPATATNIWRYIVRPMAIGGMLMSAGIHALQDEEEPRHGARAVDRRRQESGVRRPGGNPNGARHQFQVDLDRHPARRDRHVLHLPLLRRVVLRGARRNGGHDRRGVLLRGRLRIPRRDHRIEQ